MQWWEILVGVTGGLVIIWLVLVVALLRAARGRTDAITLVDALRLGPDVVRLTRRLAADPTVPRGVRLWLALLLVYLVMPFDLIPDFIPVIGLADDAIVVALVLRFATKHAGPEAVERHWPGRPAGLDALRRVVGLGS